MSGNSNTSRPASQQDIFHDAWDNVVGGFDWLKSVFIGEFADHRPLSAVIADMLISFIPAVVIVTSSRDAIAVILRMAKHPEKREEVMEWVLLCACLITIALPLAMAGAGAAAGAAAAGVGAIGGVVVGGVAGSELGAALRAVMLLLIKAATKLTDILQFLQKFMKGNILQFLKAIKFAQYGGSILSAIKSFTGKLTEIVKGLAHYINMLPSTQYTRSLLAKLTEWEHSFYAVQTDAAKWVPRALAELDARLAKALAEAVRPESHVVPAGIKAPTHTPPAPPKQEVRDVPGRVFRDAEEAKPAATAGSSSKPAVGGSNTPTPPPKKPYEKPPRKDKPDQPAPADNKINTKSQQVKDPELSIEEKIRQRQRDNETLKSSPKFKEDMEKVGVNEQQISDMYAKKRPLGFESEEQFNQFKYELNEALKSDGLDDASVGLKGTSTTFYSENPGKALGHHWDADLANPGDYDFNVSSEKMVKKLSESGVSPSEKYGIFKTSDMETNFSALDNLQQKWEKSLGREVNFVGNPTPPVRDLTEYILR